MTRNAMVSNQTKVFKTQNITNDTLLLLPSPLDWALDEVGNAPLSNLIGLAPWWMWVDLQCKTTMIKDGVMDEWKSASEGWMWITMDLDAICL